jgi:hypothetical protein
MEHCVQEIASAGEYGILKQSFILERSFVKIYFLVTEATSLPTDSLVKYAAGKKYVSIHNYFSKVRPLSEITMRKTEIVRKLHTNSRLGIECPDFTNKQTLMEGYRRFNKYLCQVGSNPVPVGKLGKIKLSPNYATVQIEMLSPSNVIHDIRCLDFTAFQG